jgi:polyisoprenoid-binding protein YceI
MRLIITFISALVLLYGLANASEHKIDDSHTSVGFSVKHLMITNVKGEFKIFKGNLDFNHENKTFKVLKAIVETKSVDTGIEKRDKHLRSKDFFLTTKYPEMTFVMTSYEKDDETEGKMIGDLTIRGITKSVTFDVEDIGTIKDFKGINRVGFTLKGKINRHDFNLKWNKALEFGGVAVSNTVKITVDIEAIEL